ncbi:MAG: hypothetical protein IJR15_04780 [Clostridiales bacterium]|nr:hypothetical protein [Clostridiales bacterium]
MNKNSVIIDNTGNGFAEALEISNKMGVEAGLDKKELLRLRLLTEETIGLLRGIAGDIKAEYTIAQYGKEFTLSLNGDVVLDKTMHDQLIDASTRGENSAVKGFTGKLKEMIGTMLLPGTLGHTVVSGLSMGLTNMGSPASIDTSATAAKEYLWSLEKYEEAVKESNNPSATDMLEKSIIANVADEVQVNIVNPHVEIKVFKIFS